jgi:hypothetical protein
MSRTTPLGLLVSLLVAATGCTSANPATPTATASVTTPRAVTPANVAQIANNAQPVTLTVQNAVVTQSAGTTYTFEVATDAAFANKVQTKSGVAEGTSGQTSLTLATLPAGASYYWHAQVTAGGTTGLFSTAFQFTIGPAIVIGAPTPLAPANGASTSTQPMLTVANAGHTGPVGPLTYRFDISTSPTFGAVAVTGSVVEGATQTSFTPSVFLTLNTTYYWRATAVDVANVIAGPASTVQSFTVNQPNSVAITIAAALGVVLWPGNVPPGTNGQATLGDNWQIQTLFHVPTGTSFQSPTIEMVRFFDLFDRGFDPQSAINWLNGNGYPTGAQWYPPPDKAVLGLQFVYLAARNKVVAHGTWDLVLKTE